MQSGPGMLTCTPPPPLPPGIAVRFWTAEEVFSDAKASARHTVFHPAIPKEAAARRHAKWLKAVQRSFDLADLGED